MSMDIERWKAMVKFMAARGVFEQLDALGVAQDDPIRFEVLGMVDAAVERQLMKESISQLH
jgi:hypothetical protein